MSEQNESGSRGAWQLPPIGEKVWVQCGSYRTMAYQDESGVWRRLSNNKEMTGIIKVEWPEEG
jgi:hypothetical protein